MTILVTGVAGFIGYHVATHLLARGESVVGIDNINDYYDTRLKEARLNELKSSPHAENFQFTRFDIADDDAMKRFFESLQIDSIVHLAAQAGVRYSIDNPHAYIESNIRGFMNILAGALNAQVKHLVYASSSSVYGNSKNIPFSTSDQVDNPVSMYAATKKSNELMAHVYSHLYQMPTTGLRFFTVYGPWGRPDMSPFIFADAIFNGTPIQLFNYGKHQRDFTYIDDIVAGVVNVLDSPPGKNGDALPYKIYNIGNNSPVELLDYVETLERHIGKKAVTELAPLQPGDVVTTYADVEDLERDIGYRPETSIDEGVGKFIEWYRNYYGFE